MKNKLEKIISFLEEKISPDLKESWDNVGLMVGDRESEITGVLLALDITSDVIAEALNLGANLIITHHPLIFEPLKNITCDDYVGNLVCKLIKNDISLYSLHTNLDKADGGVNDRLAEILELSDVKTLNELDGIGKIGRLEESISLSQFVSNVKEELNSDIIKYVGNPFKEIKTVAIVGGAGSDYVIDAFNEGADVLLTSEVKQNYALYAKEKGIALIDAGHYETEAIILNYLFDMISEQFKLPICISKSEKSCFNIIRGDINNDEI